MLTQVAPNLGPIAWESVKGTDGIDRQIQWQARVEGRTNSTLYPLEGIPPRGIPTSVANTFALPLQPP